MAVLPSNTRSSFQGSGGVPGADAFYFPADTCRHACMWFAWPTNDHVLQKAVAALVGAAAAFEPITLLATPDGEKTARAACGGAADIVVLPHQSLRLRDTGPTFLVDGKGGSAGVDWRFNAWGHRQQASDDTDVALAHALLGTAEVRRFRAPLTLESSSFVGDGYGTLLALAPAVFDTARNPQLTSLEAFGIFQDWLGVSRVIWLNSVHAADSLHTDIRALAAFAAPGLVAVTKVSSDHPLGARLSAVETELVRARDAHGNHLEIVRLPAPQTGEGLRSYTNFVPLNGGLLLPTFDDAQDDAAAAILREAFPERVVQPIPALDLAVAGLTLTSLALPQPARLLERDRATVLPRSAWSQPTPDAEALLQHYADLASGKS